MRRSVGAAAVPVAFAVDLLCGEPRPAVHPVVWIGRALSSLGAPWPAITTLSDTADAMWGSRGPFEWAGKWAARADDVLSFLPARITALALALAARRWPLELA